MEKPFDLIEKLKKERFWGTLTVSKTYTIKRGEILHVQLSQLIEESKIPKTGGTNEHSRQD